MSGPKNDLPIRVVTAQNNSVEFERWLEMPRDCPDENYATGSSPLPQLTEEKGDRRYKMIMSSNFGERPRSLTEYLLDQFSFCNIPIEVREFGQFVIRSLDHYGRLPCSLPDVVRVYGKPISDADAQKALQIIQRLDPPGCGARDAKECLLLQLREDSPYRDVLATLITSHLDDLTQNRLPRIERKTGYTLETIKQAVEHLRQMNPFPGFGFGPKS